MHDLDGDLLFELRIRALGKVNLAHPAAPRVRSTRYGPMRSPIIFEACTPARVDLQTDAALAAGCCLRV